jgi:glycosyltransferase involved in cell wall biosynthesis
MESEKLVSVIITTYYRNDNLRRAIESVKQQTYDPIEIIVVDDSGEEYARKIVSDYDINYISKDSNEGQIAAWNTGITCAQGSLVQFLDDDDELLRTKIKKQVSKYERCGSGVIYSGMTWENGRQVNPDRKVSGNIIEQVLTLNTSPCVTSTMLIERNALESISPIPKYPAATDDVLKIELAQKVNIGFVNEPLIIRGVGDDTISGSMKKIEAWWKILQDYDYLYNRYPSSIRKKAIAHIYYNLGNFYQNQTNWSPKAPLNFLRALYYSPQTEKKILIELVRSIGGGVLLKVMKKYLG